jgi:AraC-like DNA-binding protein
MPIAPRLLDRTEFQVCHVQAVSRVILSMHDRLEAGMSMQEMAQLACISPFHFNRIFHRVVGLPPHQFLTALRFRAAKNLLSTTRRRIIDICLEVGFSSPGTFSRRFTDLVGLSPREFRMLAYHPWSAPREGPVFRTGTSEDIAISGEVLAPQGFSGPVFVGLFNTPLPHRRPVGCCYLDRPRHYAIPRVQADDYYLLALAFPDTATPAEYLSCDNAWRAGSTNKRLTLRNGRPHPPVNLQLRPSEITDPPILITLPWLLARSPASQIARDSRSIGL